MRKTLILLGLASVMCLSLSIFKGLESSVYDWEKLTVKKTPSGDIRSFFLSPTRSLAEFDIKAVTLNQGTKGNGYQIKDGFDELIIVKEGTIEILVNNEKKILAEGSVIVASAGDEVYITNPGSSNSVYYWIGFEPNKKGNAVSEKEKKAAIFIDWNNIEFKPSANGGRRSIMQQKTSALRELEMHVTTLKEGLPSHAAHTHADEEIILVRKGFVEETIKGKPYRLGPGSIIFLTNDDFHGISNAGKGECEYYAIRWLTE
jgi:quercetin dioxygenase-like cupin family protein